MNRLMIGLTALALLSMPQKAAFAQSIGDIKDGSSNTLLIGEPTTTGGQGQAGGDQAAGKGKKKGLEDRSRGRAGESDTANQRRSSNASSNASSRGQGAK